MKKILSAFLVLALLLTAAFALLPADTAQAATGDITAVSISQNGGGNLIKFNAATVNYGVFVKPGASLTITATAANDFVTIQTSDGSASIRLSGTASISLPASDSVTVQVKSDTGAITYNFNIHEAAALNSLIATFTGTDGSVSNLALSPTFAYDVLKYSVTTPEKDGTVSFNASCSDGVTLPTPISLTAGSSVTQTVIAGSGKTACTYNVTVNRPAGAKSTVNTLSTLRVTNSAGTALYSGAPATATTVYNTGSYINIAPTLSDSKATYVILREGVQVATNTAANSQLITTNGTTNFTVIVTAQSGASRTYTLQANYASTATSNNAYLSELYLASRNSTSLNYRLYFDENFSKTRTSYTAYIPSDMSKVYVMTEAEDRHSTVKVDGSSNNVVSISTRKGGTDIEVEVTAQNGTTRTYDITVIRVDANASDDCTLDELYLRTSSSASSEVELTPSFKTSTKEYTAYPDSKYDSIRVYAEAREVDTQLRVNGELMESNYTTVDINSKKETKIEIMVIAANREDSATYEVILNPDLEDDNFLSALRLYTSKGQLTLSPTFVGRTTAYTATAAADINSIQVRPTAVNSDALIKVNNKVVESGDYSDDINLNSGVNYINISVKGDRSTTRNYTVTVTKSAATTTTPTTPTTPTTNNFKTLKLNIGSSIAYAGDSSSQLGAAPFLYTYGKYQYTMVPIRFISENMGKSVDWQDVSKKITIKDGSLTIVMTAGSLTATVNSKSVTLNAPPVITNGTTFVPVRFVTENLNCDCKWDNTAKSVTVTPKK